MEASAQNKLALKLPPGFHFQPTNDELVVHFLRRKIAGLSPLLPILINLLDHRPDHLTYYTHNMAPDHLTDMEQRQNMDDPDVLLEKYRECGEGRWFFFTKREKKYNVSPRPVRTTANGSWKATGSVRVIYTTGAGEGDGEVVGRVRTLVYYANHDDKPTDWTLYEYESVASLEEAQNKNTDKLDEWVLWTIQKKQNCGKNGERKAAKRKAPSPDSGSNKGNKSAEEEQNNSSAAAGVNKGGKERKGKKGKKKKKKNKKGNNPPDESTNANQNNADLLLEKRSPAPPTLPLPEPLHLHPQGDVFMDAELTLLDGHLPFNFNTNYSMQMQQAMAAALPLDDVPDPMTALAFLHLPPRAMPPVPTFIIPPGGGAMSWPQETQSHGSSSSYYGASMMSQNYSSGHHPAIRSCSYVGRRPIPSFPVDWQYGYMAAPAPSGAQAHASIGDHHASIAHSAPATRYGYADFGFGGGLSALATTARKHLLPLPRSLHSSTSVLFPLPSSAAVANGGELRRC